MADDTNTAAPDAPPVPEPVQTDLDLTRAGLTHDEAVQLDVTIAPHLADGTLDENMIFHGKLDAEAAHDAWEHAKDEQHAETVAANEGNVAAAHDHGINAGYDLQRAEDAGGGVVHTTIDAIEDKQYDSNQQLAHAQWEASTAHEYVADAGASAASGHYEEAATSTDTAAEHHDNAVDHTSEAVHHDDGGSASAESAAASETSGETAV
jgi:hypothetical protein